MKIIFSELLEKTNIIESLQNKLEQKESEFTSMKNELHRVMFQNLRNLF